MGVLERGRDGMSVQCKEKSTCSFHKEHDVCAFCQTKLRSTDRELREVNRTQDGNVYFGEGGLLDRKRDDVLEVVWTF